MKSMQDCYTLNNGMKIPCIGFGTYKTNDFSEGVRIVKDAIEAGYRYFDTASLYETERALGQALKESGLKREEYFVATKVWIDEMGREETKQAFQRSLERLQLDYVDLYLIHWPRRMEGDQNWKTVDKETWQAMEELVDEGKIKALGLSNFLPHHLDHILSFARIKPVVDQLELHPGYSQEAAVDYCKEKGIRPQAWSPLGRSRTLNHPFLKEMAEKYHKSTAQISLRFLLQKGIIPLPKASSIERMRENAEIFDFEISREDMQMLSCMPQDLWLGEHPDFAIPKKKSNRNQ
ncbi:MAG: aldo/keto reductase [Eubacteriales bacterium]|nr:aldo/keto reductase [Eubacteriales bacterium]